MMISEETCYRQTDRQGVFCRMPSLKLGIQKVKSKNMILDKKYLKARFWKCVTTLGTTAAIDY